MSGPSVVACAVLLSAGSLGCGGRRGGGSGFLDSGMSTRDAGGFDSGSTPPPDSGAMPTPDSGPSLFDAGPPRVDAGGPPRVDAGGPPRVDAGGPPRIDSGLPGLPDAGLPVLPDGGILTCTVPADCAPGDTCCVLLPGLPGFCLPAGSC